MNYHKLNQFVIASAGTAGLDVTLLLFSPYDSLQPHKPQYARLPCPSLSPGVCSNSRPLSQWCHSTISFSVTHFFSCPQFSPASRSSLHIRWPKHWSFSFSISLSNKYSGLISFRIDWFGLLVVQGTLKSLLQHHNSKSSILLCSPLLWSNSHICTWLLEKP